MVNLKNKKTILNFIFFIFIFSYFEIIGSTFQVFEISRFTLMFFSIDCKFLFFSLLIFLTIIYNKNLDFLKKISKF